MAVNYVTQKCTSCAGTKLQYIDRLKAWRCEYCGTLIERHEQVDTLFTIKNVVRQVLVDVAYLRFDSARNNLVECEKIDSRYVGTILGEIVYSLNMILYGGVNEAQQRNFFSQLKKNYMALTQLSPSVSEDEIALYEFLDSSEATGTLILAFDFLEATDRRDFLFNFFKPEEVYSMHLNTMLTDFAIKRGKFELFDEIIKNADNIEKVPCLFTVLSNYPDSDRKIENVKNLIVQCGAMSENERGFFEEYLQSTSDSTKTKNAVVCALGNSEARPSISVIMESVISHIDDTTVLSATVDSILQRELLDVEIYTIIEYALSACTADSCVYILGKMKSTNQFVQLSHKHYCLILTRQDHPAERQKILDAALSFGALDRTKDAFISYYLCEVNEKYEYRILMLDYLLPLVEMISSASVEKYIVLTSIDGEMKPSVVKKIFGMKNNMSFLRNTLNSYITSSQDSHKTKNEVVCILLESGLTATPQACLQMITQGNVPYEQRLELLSRVTGSCVSSDEMFNLYINSVDYRSFESAIFSQLMSGITAVNDSVFMKYLIGINDLSAAKVNNISKMVQLSYNRPESIMCTINHNGNSVTCNTIQAYILVSPDDPQTAEAVAQVLCHRRPNLNTEVIAGGSRVKFKKYLSAQKNSLSQLTQILCDTCRI